MKFGVARAITSPCARTAVWGVNTMAAAMISAAPRTTSSGRNTRIGPPLWRWQSQSNSREDLSDHFPRHVGQAEIAAAVAIRQLGVVDAQQVQDRGVDVVHVD